MLWTRATTLKDLINDNIDIFNFNYDVDMDKRLFEYRVVRHFLCDEIGYPLNEFLSRFEDVIINNIEKFNDIVRINNIEYDVLNRDLIDINTESNSDTDSSTKDLYEESGKNVNKVMPFTAIQSNSNYVTNQDENENESTDSTTSKTKNTQQSHKKGYTFPMKVYQEMIKLEKEKYVNPFDFLFKELEVLFCSIY